ncbi:MAG TPA: hypothetical protein VHR45_02815 [Thermoanaerobaculia bacterium]|nr:hypothetical protein [Thermoanaerobaculia bacterium]
MLAGSGVQTGLPAGSGVRPGEPLIFVALFPAQSLPGLPAACALLRRPGSFELRRVPDGIYHLLAAAVPHPGRLWAEFLGDHQGLVGGSFRQVIAVSAGSVLGPTDLRLRTANLSDPPLLTCLPLLLRQDERLAQLLDGNDESTGDLLATCSALRA